MTTITVMVTLHFPDPCQPPDEEYIEATIENVLVGELEERNAAFKGCSHIEAEVEEDVD